MVAKFAWFWLLILLVKDCFIILDHAQTYFFTILNYIWNHKFTYWCMIFMNTLICWHTQRHNPTLRGLDDCGHF